jgi:hypothetical protein
MPYRSLPQRFGVQAGGIGLLLMVAVCPTPTWATGITTGQAAPAAATAPPATLLSPGLLSPGGTPPALQARRANFLGEAPSPDARRVADWAVSSGDNAGLPFVVIDKIGAKLFVFDATGLLRGASMALLGLAHGDVSLPGIGQRKLALIRPEERVTPAGRFVATLGRDLEQDILWVDYDDAISLHRVVTGSPGDHRRQRLLGISPLNKRISYGCINVPPRFYDEVVLKAFSGTSGIVYILPEQHKLEDVFPLSDPAPRGKL